VANDNEESRNYGENKESKEKVREDSEAGADTGIPNRPNARKINNTNKKKRRRISVVVVITSIPPYVFME
jgi:hypothetical protein